METFLLACILIVLLVRWIILHNRFQQLESRIDELSRQVQRNAVERTIYRPPVVETPPAPVDTPAPVIVPEPPAPEPEPVVMPEPPIEIPPQPVASEERPAFEPMPQPAAARVDWEAAVGGNLLNKAGVVLLVIGLALALAYSFAHIGPLGRVAISLAVSLAMLVAGVVVERREQYRVFARGLLGGGWAGLYTTVYAMHAVKEALVVPDPVAGAVLLIAVATGMIVHSMRYRSQAVTGLAYFIAFGTLAITEANTLAIVALIPLAVSLLYIANRFAWIRMALLGMVATYAVIVIRGDHGAPLWQAQALFTIFWLVFETFDVMHPDAWLLPLNAAGFLGLSLLKWNAAAPQDVWMLLAASSAGYLASALARVRVQKWHTAATLSAALAAAAIFQRLDHAWVAPALLVEAELVYLAGLRLKAPYLRWLGTGLFAVQTGRLLFDVVTLAPSSWAGTASVEAAVLYANRALEAADFFFGFVAAGLVALVIGFEAPEKQRSLEWLALAAGSATLGWWRRLGDFRLHGYLVGIGALTVVAAEAETNQPALWAALLFSYGLALAAQFFPVAESRAVRFAASIAATLAAATLAWRIAPGDYLGLVWMALALVILELGARDLPPEFQFHAYAIALLGAVRVWVFNLTRNTGHEAAIAGVATVLIYALSARTWTLRQFKAYAATLVAGTMFLLMFLNLAVAEPRTAPLWALAALVLGVAGARWNEPVMRYSGHAVAALAFLRCWGVNFERHTEAVVAAIFTAVCFLAAYALTPRGRSERPFYALAAGALVTLLLWYEASGSVLTVAWGVEGLAVLGAGFVLRERLMRLSGLGLLLLCILKLFLWDLRHLDTLPRIFSFIVLGLILVGVSWIYTRFREHVERYL